MLESIKENWKKVSDWAEMSPKLSAIMLGLVLFIGYVYIETRQHEEAILLLRGQTHLLDIIAENLLDDQ